MPVLRSALHRYLWAYAHSGAILCGWYRRFPDAGTCSISFSRRCSNCWTLWSSGRYPDSREDALLLARLQDCAQWALGSYASFAESFAADTPRASVEAICASW
jgi:hypothetical protein